MFEKKPRVREKIDAVKQVFAQHGRDDIVTHEMLREILMFGPEAGGRYYGIVRRARKEHCKESGMWAREVPTIGFKILTRGETLVDLPARQMKRARNRIRDAARIVGSLKDSDLSFHQRRQKEAILLITGSINKKLREEKQHVSRLSRPFSRDFHQAIKECE